MADKNKRDAGKTIQEKANVLWDVANSLAGLYKPHEYGLVILPMAVVKRFILQLLPYRVCIPHSEYRNPVRIARKTYIRSTFRRGA